MAKRRFSRVRRGAKRSGDLLKTAGVPALITGATKYFLNIPYEDAVGVGGAGVVEYLMKQKKEGEALIGAGLGIGIVDFIKGTGNAKAVSASTGVNW